MKIPPRLPRLELPKKPDPEFCSCKVPLLDDDAEILGTPDDDDYPLCWRCRRPVDLRG